MVKTSLRSNNIGVSLLWLFVPLLVGILSSVLTIDMMSAFEVLNKPSLSPPAYIFPIAWSVLYSLMGVSALLVYRENTNSIYKSYGLMFNIIQLILNFFWSIIFFNYRNYELALIWLVMLWLCVLAMIVYYRKVNKLSFALNIPYLMWLTFAAYLNYFILLNN